MQDRVLHFDQYADDSSPGVVVFDTSHSAVHEHAHDFFELVYIQRGFCLHEAVKETTLLLEGDFFLVRPGVFHRYVGPHTVELFNCLFAPSALTDFESELKPLPGLALSGDAEGAGLLPKLHLDLNEQKRVTRLFRGIIDDLHGKEIGWALRVKCFLACLLVDYARAYEKRAFVGGESNAYPGYVASALGIVSQRYADPALCVSGIAQEAGVSPDYLSRQFRTLTGVGVQEYLRRYRFAKATELLLAGTPVGETSASVGFSNLCHFSREFKKEMGVTPTNYAKLNN